MVANRFERTAASVWFDVGTVDGEIDKRTAALMAGLHLLVCRSDIGYIRDKGGQGAQGLIHGILDDNRRHIFHRLVAFASKGKAEFQTEGDRAYGGRAGIGIDEAVQPVLGRDMLLLVAAPFLRRIFHDISGGYFLDAVQAYIGIESRVEPQLFGQAPLHARLHGAEQGEFEAKA